MLADVGPFSWSPASDVLAATVTDPATGRAWLCELRPGAPPRPVPGVTGPAAWSPDGRQLAFTRIQSNPRRGFFGSALETVPAWGGTPTVRRRSRKNALIVAGWWPDGRGLLAWADLQYSASLAADGRPLVSFPLSAGRPATLGWTLLHPPFLATSPSLRLVAVDAGGDRILWDRKTILLCTLTGGCAGFPGGVPGPANLDPALSSAGQTLAFVHGSAVGPRAQTFGQASIAAWYATRRLWVYILGGNPYLVSGAGTAVADPTWSADGKLLLYVRDDGLWAHQPVRRPGKPRARHPLADRRPALPHREQAVRRRLAELLRLHRLARSIRLARLTARRITGAPGPGGGRLSGVAHAPRSCMALTPTAGTYCLPVIAGSRSPGRARFGHSPHGPPAPASKHGAENV